MPVARADACVQGVIPHYGEMVDEMTTGTCVALEVITLKVVRVGRMSLLSMFATTTNK